jgi:tetratricopeptide (TPR) repeat protein
LSKAVLETLRRNMREALAHNRLRDAGDILAILKKEDPLSRETRGFELEFYINSNQLAEADSLARQLRSLFPASGRIHFLAGKLAYRQKRYDEAEDCFRESQRVYPNPQTQYWLGRTLTQTGRFDDAEALLLSAREHNPRALLDLAWLYERKNDLEAALQAYDRFLETHPGDSFAAEQRVRIRARMLEPEALIEEVSTLEGLGETVPASLFAEFVRKLFESGQAPRAREEITSRTDSVDAKLGVQLAWICYKAQAYDLACKLFLAHLPANLANRKYLVALESAAAKCNRISQVLEAYRPHLEQARHLYGHCRSLARRSRNPL